MACDVRYIQPKMNGATTMRSAKSWQYKLKSRLRLQTMLTTITSIGHVVIAVVEPFEHPAYHATLNQENYFAAMISTFWAL